MVSSNPTWWWGARWEVFRGWRPIDPLRENQGFKSPHHQYKPPATATRAYLMSPTPLRRCPIQKTKTRHSKASPGLMLTTQKKGCRRVCKGCFSQLAPGPANRAKGQNVFEAMTKTGPRLTLGTPGCNIHNNFNRDSPLLGYKWPCRPRTTPSRETVEGNPPL